jgi:hypothetical protein
MLCTPLGPIKLLQLLEAAALLTEAALCAVDEHHGRRQVLLAYTVAHAVGLPWGKLGGAPINLEQHRTASVSMGRRQSRMFNVINAWQGLS